MPTTPVHCLEPLSSAATTLWVKRDDLTSPIYGGTKVRKLGPLLADARQRGATKLVTLGALGSHHVLATAVFGARAGFSVEAVVLSRPGSRHVLETTRASIAQGAKLVPARSFTEAARHLASAAAAGAYSIPAGGSSLLGTRGVEAAALELAEQVRAGELPEPDLIVVALGSGGTAGGLAAGLLHARLCTRVLGVAVAEPTSVFAHQARQLAKALTLPTLHAAVLQRFELDQSQLGAGYGHPTLSAAHALEQAARVGLTLDLTYTAKAFAAALERVALGRERHVLFWHTLSTTPLAPLLVGAPSEQELPSELRDLVR